MKPAAFDAVFANCKFFPSRSTMQVILEVDIAKSAQVYDVLGAPQADKSVWVAVARLDKSNTGDAPQERRRFEDMPAAQRAGIICKEDDFRSYVAFRVGCKVDAADAEQWLRDQCGVKSRAEIDKVPAAEASLNKIISNYRLWLRANAET